MSINIGSMLGFAVCGYLGERIGWHWGFGAAGIGMLLGVYNLYSLRIISEKLDYIPTQCLKSEDSL